MSQFTTGTVDLTNGSPTVSAALGVDWGGLSLPALFNVQGDSGVVVYDVTAFNAPAPGSRWTLTLAAPFAGVSADNASYAISRDFTPVLGLPLLNFGDVNTAGLFNRAMKKLDGSIVVATGPQGAQGIPGVGFTSVVVVDANTIRITYGDGSTVDVDLPAGPQGIPGTNGLDGVGEQGPQGIPGNDGAGITDISVLDPTHIRITYGSGSHVDVEIPLPRSIESVTIPNPTESPELALVSFTDGTTSPLTLPIGPAGAQGNPAVWQIQAGPFDNAPIPVPAFDGQLGLATGTAEVWQGSTATGTWTNMGSIRGIPGSGTNGLGWQWTTTGAASGSAPAGTLNFDGPSADVAVNDGTGIWTVIGNLRGPQGNAGAAGLDSTVPGPAGNDGVGIVSITQPTGTSFQVNLSNGTTQGPFEIPAGAQGMPGADSTVQGPAGNNGADGVWVISLTQTDAFTVYFNLSNATQIGPVTLPAGPQGPAGNDSMVQGPQGNDGVGISSITQPTGTSIQVNLTNGGTEGPFELPAGPAGNNGADSMVQGPEGPAGNGIASMTQTTETNVHVEFTNGTNTDFALPVGPQGIQGDVGGTGVGISSIVADGDQLTVHLTNDAPDQGPFTIPTGPTGATGPSKVSFTIRCCGGHFEDVTTGAINGYARSPYDMSITELRASVFEAPAGGSVDLDIFKNRSVMPMTGTTLQIGEGQLTSGNAGPMSDTLLSADDEVTVIVGGIGGMAPGKGLIVTVVGTLILPP